MENKLKIGFLIDNLEINDLDQEIIYHIDQKNICEKYVILNQVIPKPSLNFYIKKFSFMRIVEKLLIKGIHLFEKKVLYSFVNYKYEFKKIDKSYFFKNIINLSPIISEKRLYYDYSNKDLEIVKKQNLDVIIRLGSGIIKGEMLNTPKFGIFSFHHGDNKIFRGGPPGFWEVYHKKNSTGFVIQKLNNILDGGKILFRGLVETKSFYYLNKISIYKNSAKYLSLVLSNLQNDQLRFFDSEIDNSKIYKDPKFHEIIKYLFNTYFYFLKKFISRKFFKKRIRWFVSFKKSENINQIQLDNFNVIKNNDKDRFLADPFVIEKDGKNFVFVEDFYFSKNKGIISCFEIENEDYKFIGTAIKENFHLSFPYIFKYKNKIFMCPESHENKDIRLYESKKFPLQWELSKILVKNISAVDSIIFEKDKLWWLVTSISTSSNVDFNELNIFYSENGPVTDKWIPHKLNPITVNSKIARNGGVIFQDNKIFRIAQKNSFNLYGNNFSINEIKILDKENYKEEILKNINPDFTKGIKGTHHLHNNKNFFVNDFCL